MFLGRVQNLVKRSCLGALLLPFCLFAQAESKQSYTDLQNYQGSYQFADGTIVTGGRMDESGRVMLSYLDTKSVSRGGIFDASGDSFTGLFGTRASIAFEKDGDVMLWMTEGGQPLRAQKIMTPETQPASFSNGNVRLEGTLYLPPGANNKLPAVVLAHGSGPTTRHLGPWITFFVQEGFAVLSFDKRGTGDSEGDWQRSTYLDLSADLVAAGRWLSDHPNIDATRIGLKTSSQSGWYGPATVDESEIFAFLIQRAGPAVNFAVGTGHEIRCELKSDGVAPRDIDAAVSFWLELHEMASNGASLEFANEFLRAARDEDWFETSYNDWDAITALWWHQHTANMKLEPAASTALLEVPVLWFLAENDENVPYRESIAALESAKERKADLSVVTVHNAGHSFVVSNSDEGLQYTDQYWATMARWMAENVAKPTVTPYPQ